MEALFRLKREQYPEPVEGTRVIKADEFEQLCRAREIVEQAQRRAQEILRQAEEVYKQRYESGYADGVEFGKMQHAEKVMETVLASVEFIENIENTVVSVVNQAVRKIIGEIDDEERMRRIVGTALNNVRGQQKVTVRVSPKDEPAVSKALAAMTGGTYLTVVADARLTPQSCILESDLGVIDASLQTQLAALEHAFTAKIRQ